MINLRTVGIAVAAAFVLQGCYYPTTPVPAPRSMQERFEQSWQAARGAASDAGVRVSQEDRPSGTLRGAQGSSNVVITVIPQADQTIQVGISVSGGTSSQDENLRQRLNSAYQRRMGR
ncbi:MAG TPA: hypothetical protein VKB50_01630 [Vicinamibacterales bacterium]|nr:hypothetical protein [Vicinamibacterales bacterium]